MKSSSNLDIDTRIQQMRFTKGLGVLEQMVLLYPRLIPITHLSQDVSFLHATFYSFFVLIGANRLWVDWILKNNVGVSY